MYTFLCTTNNVTLIFSPKGQRSRCGSISLGGVERRGSYYSEEVSKRSTVAVVVDDPEGKKQMADALRGVFAGQDEQEENGEQRYLPFFNLNKILKNLRF